MAGLWRGWGLDRREARGGGGGGEGAAASPGPLPLGTPAASRPGPTLWSSIAAAQLVPDLLAGPALSSSPRAALPLPGANSPPSPRRRSRAPSQRSITDRSAQARRPRGRLGNVVLCWGRQETEPPTPRPGTYQATLVMMAEQQSPKLGGRMPGFDLLALPVT